MSYETLPKQARLRRSFSEPDNRPHTTAYTEWRDYEERFDRAAQAEAERPKKNTYVVTYA